MFLGFGSGEESASAIALAKVLAGKPIGICSRYFSYAFTNLDFFFSNATLEVVIALMFISITPGLMFTTLISVFHGSVRGTSVIASSACFVAQHVPI